MSETSKAIVDDAVIDLLAHVAGDAADTTFLDEETMMLVRVAALVAVGAPPDSYLLNLAVVGDMDAEKVCGVLSAVAPIVGAARVASSTRNIVRALVTTIEMADSTVSVEERK